MNYSLYLIDINTQIDKSKIKNILNLWCYLHSNYQWFTEFCNSHEITHFTVFLIDFGTEVSMVKSCYSFIYIYILYIYYIYILLFLYIYLYK
jgi:hypothetical protein